MFLCFYLFLCTRYDLLFHARKSNKKANVTWRYSVTDRNEAKEYFDVQRAAFEIAAPMFREPFFQRGLVCDQPC